LQKAAHKLKSSSAYLGGMKLAERCKELEAMAMENGIGGVQKLVAEVVSEYQKVRPALENEMRRNSA
jgi:HPt (histidine-containing phosphotransfer) domain-containing protein